MPDTWLRVYESCSKTSAKEGACAFPLHSDDAKGPYAFRIDLSRFGISTARVVFSQELGVGTTGGRTDFVPLWG